MTGMLAEKMYSQLERENVLLSEQKGCHGVVKQKTSSSLIKQC